MNISIRVSLKHIAWEWQLSLSDLEVEKLCLANEFIKAEVMAIQQTLESYATQFCQMPSSKMKNTILASIEGNRS